MVAIIPFNNVNWEMLHWFLKFLIPKLKVKDPDQDKLDELLNSVGSLDLRAGTLTA